MSQPPFKKFGPLVALLLLVIAALLWWQGQPPEPPRAKATARAVDRELAVVPKVPAAVAVAAIPDDLTEALKQPDPRQRAREFAEALQQWIARDVDGALDFVRRMRGGPERSQAVFLLLDFISRRDVNRALTVARELISSREDRVFYSVLFDRLARENITLAADQIRLVPAGESRENALRAVADVWSRQDSAAALAWAQKLADASDRAIAIESVLQDIALRDPLRAVALAQQSLKSPSLERVVTRAVQRLTATDPGAASSVVSTLPPGDAQTMAAMEVARAMAIQDVESALAWAKTLRVELTQWLAMNNVLSVWAQKDPTAVARYVTEMQPGPGLDFIARHVASILAMNPQEAILWADALPSDSARDQALIMIASTWAQRSPAEAVKWAATLKGEPLRTEAISGAHSYWMLLDPRGARVWLDASDLPAETKSKLLRAREVQF